ncbi:hypothetical protein AA313_de0208974 [Arthrobotrys entomopaga]|nr:hypothetical protein AA313_de0208974 [Arthrobotrys entomopaga]
MRSQQQEQGLVPVDEWVAPYQDSYHYGGGPALHPTGTFASDGEADAPSEPFGLNGMFQTFQAHIDPSLVTNGERNRVKTKKGSLSKKERRERVQGDVELEQVEPTGVAEWVKNMKSKKSRKKKGSLVVTLKISPEAWKRHEAKISKEKEEKANKMAAKFGFDDVATDLAPEPKRRRIDGATGTPSKKSRPPGSRKSYMEISDDDEEGAGFKDLLSDEEVEVMPKKTSRSTRTGELVDGLTFEPSRRTGLNKSSRPAALHKGSTTKPLSFNKGDVIDLDDGESSGDDSSSSAGPPPRQTEQKSAEKPVDTPDDGRSAAYKAAVAKALLHAKRMALATAEGRSPPPASVYSSEAPSRAETEEAEDLPPNADPDETKEEEDDEEDPGSPVVGDLKLPPVKIAPFQISSPGPKTKPPLRPSKPLSKRGRPGRPKKVDKDYIAPRTPANKAASNGFTPINSRVPSIATGSVKRGRPKRDSTIGTAALAVELPAVSSPPAKRARRGSAAGTPLQPAASDTTPAKARGRPRKSLSTANESVDDGTASPAPGIATIASTETPKKKAGRPRKSSLIGSEKAPPKSNTTKAVVPLINPTSLDASRSRKVIELLRHSPPPAGDDDDDWF